MLNPILIVVAVVGLACLVLFRRVRAMVLIALSCMACVSFLSFSPRRVTHISNTSASEPQLRVALDDERRTITLPANVARTTLTLTPGNSGSTESGVQTLQIVAEINTHNCDDVFGACTLSADENPITSADLASFTSRPEWASEGLKCREDQHTMVVSSGPRSSEAECAGALADAVREGANQYAFWYAQQVHDIPNHRVSLSTEDLQQVATRRTFREETVLDTGSFQTPMFEHFSELEFGNGFRNLLSTRAKEAAVKSRLTTTGFASGGVLMLLSATFGFLKLNQNEGALDLGRLKYAAFSVILAIVVCGVVLSRWISWS